MQKLSEKERELRTKERELQRKDLDLRRKDKELISKTEALEKSKEPVKKFIHKEITQSYNAVKDAKLAHSQSPSKYTAGFVELAKGSHAENEEMFKRLAQAVGIDFESLQLDLEDGPGDGQATNEVKRPLNNRKITPREVSVDCSHMNHS